MYLTAVSLQSVICEVCVCMVGLIRDDVGLLDAIYGFDPGQSHQLLIVQKITISFRLWETGRWKKRDKQTKRERDG